MQVVSNVVLLVAFTRMAMLMRQFGNERVSSAMRGRGADRRPKQGSCSKQAQDHQQVASANQHLETLP